jgi:hypothetical protein
MLATELAVTAAITVGMIATIGGIALAAAFARERLRCRFFQILAFDRRSARS